MKYVCTSAKHSTWNKCYVLTRTINIHVEIKCQLDATDYIYCRFYFMLNMFRAILCPSSGAREYYTDGRCLWYLVLWFSGCPYGVELKVMCPVCRLQPETCWACNKYHLLHLVGILFPHNNDDARSKSLQKYVCILTGKDERIHFSSGLCWGWWRLLSAAGRHVLLNLT